MHRLLSLVLLLGLTTSFAHEVVTNHRHPVQWDFSPLPREPGTIIYVDGVKFKMIEFSFPNYDSEEILRVRLPSVLETEETGFESGGITVSLVPQENGIPDACYSHHLKCYTTEISGYPAFISQRYTYSTRYTNSIYPEGDDRNNAYIYNRAHLNTGVTIYISPTTHLFFDFSTGTFEQEHRAEITDIATMASALEIPSDALNPSEREYRMRLQRRLIRYVQIAPAP